MGDPRDETKRHGPSWWDCARIAEDIQVRHDVAISIVTLPHVEKGRGITSWWLQVHAKPPKQLSAPSIQVGSAWFRGNRGATTYTTALWWALSELNEKLTERGGQAALPGF